VQKQSKSPGETIKSSPAALSGEEDSTADKNVGRERVREKKEIQTLAELVEGQHFDKGDEE
jgi:hypothetical protein